MCKRKHLVQVIVAFGLAAGGSAFAQDDVGTVFTYQGYLTTGPTATPVHGPTDFEFELYDQDTGGTQYGPTLTILAHDVVDGVFTVELDFGLDPWVPNIALWLDIAVRHPAGGGSYTPLGRQRLTPTPFSLATRGINVNAAGDVGIGTPTPAEKLEVQGNVRATKVLASAFASSSPLIMEAPVGTERARIDDVTGHFAIANTDPLTRLHVTEVPIATSFSGALWQDDTIIEDTAAWSGLYSSDEIDGAGLTLAQVPAAGPVDKWGVYRRFTGAQSIFDVTWGEDANPTTDPDALRMRIEATGDTHLAPMVGDVGIGFDGDPDATLHVRNMELPGASEFQAWYENDIIVEGSNSWLGLYSDHEGGIGSGITFAEIAADPNDNNKWAIYRRTTGNVGDLNFTFGPNAEPGTNTKIMQLKQDGTVVVSVLEITGADLAEKFPVSEEIQPGMVVSIDPDNPGELRVARGAYNRRVAGIVSGANNLPTGAVLGNLADSGDALPVALNGRVWCWCDASFGSIEPGDRLTTSDTPGHAMKVTDDDKAPGAVIGKAMTRLAEAERGLVLVLVNLQ